MKFFSKLLWLLLAFLQPSFLGAQKNTSAKLYGHLALFDSRTVLGLDQNKENVVHLNSLAPAFRWEEESGRYRELELSALSRERIDDGRAVIEEYSFALRYERGYPISKNNSGMKVRLGWSARGYFGNRTADFYDLSEYPAENQYYGLILSLTPHIEYNISRRLYFDFSPNLELLNFCAGREYVYNPDYDEEQNESIDFFFLPFRPLLRIGAGFRFFKKNKPSGE